MGSPIIVLGASGLVGSALMKCLPEGTSFGLTRTECDVTKPDQVEAAVTQYKPGVVINASGYTDVDGSETNREQAEQLNTHVPGVLAEITKKHACLLVHLSSDYVFDGETDTPYLEDDPPNPLSFYGTTKLDGEKEVQKKGGEWLIVRTAWIFGHNGRDFVKTILKLARQENELRIVDDQIGSPTYAVDFSRHLLGLINNRTRGIVHLVNSGRASWYTLARQILDLAGFKDLQTTPIPTTEMPRPAQRPKFSVLDNTKYLNLTGHKPRTWNEALASALKQEGLLS